MNAPLTYDEVMNSPDSQKWLSAMDDEIKSLQLNDTYTLTEPPTNKSITPKHFLRQLVWNPSEPSFRLQSKTT